MIQSADRVELVCMRVADCPRPVAGCSRQRCEVCGSEIWVSPASGRAAGRGAALMCVPCWSLEVGKNGPLPKVATPTREQLGEVANALRRAQERKADDR